MDDPRLTLAMGGARERERARVRNEAAAKAGAAPRSPRFTVGPNSFGRHGVNNGSFGLFAPDTHEWAVEAARALNLSAALPAVRAALRNVLATCRCEEASCATCEPIEAALAALDSAGGAS